MKKKSRGSGHETRYVRLQTRLTDWLGRVSYSIYLLHPIVAELIYLRLVSLPVASPWRAQPLAVYLAVVTVLTLWAYMEATRVIRPCVSYTDGWGHSPTLTVM